MIRGVASKVMWVGRATVFLVGLAVILALLFGVISRAAAHSNVDNKLFHLAHANSASKPTALVSTLADAAKSALIVNNKSGGSALDLKVSSNEVAPMKVNSNKVVGKLNSDMVDGKHAGAFLPRGGTAANSDKLDDKDSSEFANATHAHSGADITSGQVDEAHIDNSIARDSEVSNGFIQGRGLAQHRARAFSPGENLFFWQMSNPDLSVSYNCPGDLASNGFIGIKNTSGTETVNAFSDNGLDNPFYNQLDPNEFWSQGAAAGGERISFQVQGTYVATIEVFSVHRTGDNKCHVQAQALITKP